MVTILVINIVTNDPVIGRLYLCSVVVVTLLLLPVLLPQPQVVVLQ